MCDDMCIITIECDRIEARYRDKNGRPRSYLIAFTDGETVEWRRNNTVATIGTIEIDNDGSVYVKIPIK